MNHGIWNVNLLQKAGIGNTTYLNLFITKKLFLFNILTTVSETVLCDGWVVEFVCLLLLMLSSGILTFRVSLY